MSEKPFDTDGPLVKWLTYLATLVAVALLILLAVVFAMLMMVVIMELSKGVG